MNKLKTRNSDIAALKLSGCRLAVGTYVEKDTETIYIQIEDSPEPIYISGPEARLLIASLEAGIAELGELGPRY